MIQRASMESRVILVPGTYNLRDVGGYPTHEGLDVRWGVLYRSDGLSNLDSGGLDGLAALGVRTVIDLRRDAEISRAPNPCAGDSRFAYLNIPLLTGPGGPDRHPRELTELYRAYLDHGHASIRAVLATIAATPPDQAVLVHCTAGKDRTGLVVALALSAAGVLPEAIVADYALTGPLIEPLRAMLRAAAEQQGLEVAALEPLLGCEPAHMRCALRHLDARHGSAAAYLHAIGLPAPDMDRLRVRLLGA